MTVRSLWERITGSVEHEEVPDECPMGGEHEIAEVRTAIRGEVLRRRCTKCRESFPVTQGAA